MNDADQYDEDYYIRGVETGKSLYSNYRWLPDLSIPMAQCMANHLGVCKGDTILDFGCARGYTVKALRILGYQAFGMDISRWAIQNADPDINPYLTWIGEGKQSPLFTEHYDWIIAKDVLEHVYFVKHMINILMRAATKGVFVVVPLSGNGSGSGGKYVIPDYEKDITHVQRHSLTKWVDFFLHPAWSVECAYRVPGIKDNWMKPGWEKGNGFLTARRIIA